MRKKASRILGTILVGAMILGTMAGCGAEDGANSDSVAAGNPVESLVDVEATGITYPLDTDETLSIAIINDKPIAAVSKDITATPFAKALSEQTGVDIEFIVLEDYNAMNLMFADAELPDIVWGRPYTNYSGGPSRAISDGVLLPITKEEMNTYAPDYMAVVNAASEDVARTIKTDDGEYIGFAQITDDIALQNTGGMVLRADWLRELNMEVPTNPEELEAYLQACVDKGIEKPFPSMQITQAITNGFWTSPFGLVRADLYQVDGEVHCGYAEPEYKDVLVWLKSLVDKGLMDTSFTKYENGVYGDKQAVWHGAVGGGIGTWLAAMEVERPEFDVVAMPSMPGPNGETPMSGTAGKPVGSTYCWITPACANKELALQFLNFCYTEAGYMLFNFGVEGESYTMVDGVPTYTEWITQNPDGLSMQQAMAQYNRAAVGGGPFVQSVEYAKQYFWRPQQQEATETWSQHDGAKYRMPEFQVAEVDAAECAKIASDINTYVTESRVKFITGEWSFDDFETVYLKTLEDMGLARYKEIIQEACDRYYAR